MSRLVTDACTIEQVNSAEEQKKDSIPTAPTCFISLIPHFNLQDAQLHDPDIQLVIRFKKNEMPKPPLFVWLNNPMLRSLWNCWDELHLSDELLVRSIPSKYGTTKRVIVLPKCLVPRVLLSLHSGPAGGHMGISRTLSRAKERFFGQKCRKLSPNMCSLVLSVCREKLAVVKGRPHFNQLSLVSHLSFGLWTIWVPS